MGVDGVAQLRVQKGKLHADLMLGAISVYALGLLGLSTPKDDAPFTTTTVLDRKQLTPAAR